MQLVQNVPFFGIMLSMIAAVISPMLPRRIAKWLSVGVVGVIICLHIWFLQFMIGFDGSYTYMMGHYPAPWATSCAPAAGSGDRAGAECGDDPVAA